MDVNKPVTNPDLVQAIQHAMSDSAYEPQVIDELFRATFLCPGLLDNKDPEDIKIDLSIVESQSNKKYLLAFTDWNELRKWNPDENLQALLFSIDDYKAFVATELGYEGIVINPSGSNFILSREVLCALYPKQTTLAAGESVMVGIPEDYPDEMTKKLKDYFLTAKSVDIAYLLWMAKGNETSYLLVLRAKSSPEELFLKISEICKPYLDGKLLDIALLDSPFGMNAVKKHEPFYQS